MPIIASEIKTYASTTVNNTTSNGGRMSSTQIVSGSASGLFPNAQPSERTAGATKYRKFWMKVANDDDLTLMNPLFYQSRNTPGDDRIVWWPAGLRDTQSSITGSERKYGCGALQSTVLSGVTSIVVTVEDGATVIFANGDTIRITDKETVSDTGNEEFVQVSATPSIVGNNVTLTFTPALANGYLSSDTRVSSVYQPDDIEASFSNFVVTGAGSYNSVTNPVLVDHIGGIEQTWTLTFTSTTAFDISGDTVGAAGSGNVSSGASPSNAAFAKPYFTLSAAGFSGTFAIGNTIVFQTHPAALPVWARQVIPAGAGVVSDNIASWILSGETA